MTTIQTATPKTVKSDKAAKASRTPGSAVPVAEAIMNAGKPSAVAPPKPAPTPSAPLEVKKARTEVNGVTLNAGAKAWIVRNVDALDPLPKDWRDNPTDCIKASFVGYNPDQNEYIFDDGSKDSIGMVIYWTIEAIDLDRFVYAKEEAARKYAKEEGARLALHYARDDYETAQFVACLMGVKDDLAKEAVGKLDTHLLGQIPSALALPDLYKGLGLDTKRRSDAVAKVRDVTPAETRKGIYQDMVNRANRLVEKYGEQVRMTNTDAAEAADAAKKAAEDAAKAKDREDKKAAKDAQKKAEKEAAKAVKKATEEPKEVKDGAAPKAKRTKATKAA